MQHENLSLTKSPIPQTNIHSRIKTRTPGILCGTEKRHKMISSCPHKTRVQGYGCLREKKLIKNNLMRLPRHSVPRSNGLC